MQPARLLSALRGMVTSRAGQLQLPSQPGDGLNSDVRDRLNSFARHITRDGHLAVLNPAISQTASGVTIQGTAAALGFESLDVRLNVGLGDDADLRLANPANEQLHLHDTLAWIDLEVGLHADDGNDEITASWKGSLHTPNDTLHVTVTDVDWDAVPAPIWTLAAVGANRGGLSPLDFIGGDTADVAALTLLLPALSGLAPTGQLRWTPGTPDATNSTPAVAPSLRATWPGPHTLQPWPGHLSFAGTALDATLRAPVDGEIDWAAVFEIDGDVTYNLTDDTTVPGFTEHGGLRVARDPGGVTTRVSIAPADTSQLSVGNLLGLLGVRVCLRRRARG